MGGRQWYTILNSRKVKKLLRNFWGSNSWKASLRKQIGFLIKRLECNQNFQYLSAHIFAKFSNTHTPARRSALSVCCVKILTITKPWKALWLWLCVCRFWKFGRATPLAAGTINQLLLADFCWQPKVALFNYIEHTKGFFKSFSSKNAHFPRKTQFFLEKIHCGTST